MPGKWSGKKKIANLDKSGAGTAIAGAGGEQWSSVMVEDAFILPKGMAMQSYVANTWYILTLNRSTSIEK